MNDKVIIIGGGLAGLSLANVLKHQGVPYKVFERDATPQARTQGWSISLHFCLPYLKNGMDPEKYNKIGVSSSADPQSPSNHKFYVLDGDNAELFMEPIGTNFEAEVYRINRGRFRKWLLEGIDVEWNKVLDHYEVTESGVKVIFKDGSTETGSVLVGADGVNSAVCAQILGKERFQEATTVNPLQVLCGSFWMDQETRKKYEALAPMQMMIIGSYKGSARCIFSSLTDVDRSGPEPKYEMQWSISSIDPLDKQPETEQERRELVKEWSQEFDPVFQSLLNDTSEDQSIVKLIIRERSPPEDLAEKSEQGRVVLIGDAAHTMTMYRGEGQFFESSMGFNRLKADNIYDSCRW